jgi:hypothetical protein
VCMCLGVCTYVCMSVEVNGAGNSNVYMCACVYTRHCMLPCRYGACVYVMPFAGYHVQRFDPVQEVLEVRRKMV